MEKKHDFTQGTILPALLKFAIPVLLALLLQTMYGAVDLQVVGMFGTAADISAVSTGSQLMQTVTIVITGLSMGVSYCAAGTENRRGKTGGGRKSGRRRHLPFFSSGTADDRHPACDRTAACCADARSHRCVFWYSDLSSYLLLRRAVHRGL